ncbi:Ribose-5-phosphate isomerase A [Baekduia alba]|uniref:ribose 5-phosphate isomerase A n=1 Tax=Baekduia alba TaxID=2997333 RepID=UPI00233F990F|nr:ribose 5-phosphate isomerase A [Baekduia alba]WCB92833.1 Ribose-5-phosphate isomerase A [Baekduia alba]
MSVGELEAFKRAAAVAAAEEVEDGMRVGLGTGSTVAHLLPAIAARGLTRLRCVATSVATAEQAAALGLAVEPFDTLDRLDLAIDGADQIAPDGWIVKGGGGAHVREKVVAAAADRFVVIADATKVVDALTAPVPLELLAFGLAATLVAVAPATVRPGMAPSPDGNVIADYTGPIDDPAALAAFLSSVPGLVDHGLFPPALTAEVVVAGPDGVRRRTV